MRNYWLACTLAFCSYSYGAQIEENTPNLGEIRLVPVDPTPEGDNVTVKIVFPEENDVKKSNPVHLQLRVEGFPLATDSDFPRRKDIYNSDDGQSIHVVIDDNPWFMLNEAIMDDADDVEDYFDICLIDTSPSLSVLTFNALAAADSIYIPLRAGYFELRGAGMLIDTIEQLKDELNSSLKINGIILTQYDIRSNLSSDTQNELENYFGSSLMKSKIRQNVDLGKAPALAQDIFTFAPHSNGAKDYEFLALEILEREGLNTNG